MTAVLERVEAFTLEGYSDTEIAEALGVTPRTVRRYRAAAGIPSRWTPTPAQHGTRARYQRGCRCDRCKAANTAYTRADRGARARALRARQRASQTP